MNGQDSVYIDRGRWLYRFNLDAGNISIARGERAGQHLVAPDVWRCVAELGVSDVLIVPVPGGWQPFVELAEGNQRWALAQRPTAEEAEQTAAYVLSTMADAVFHHSKIRMAREGSAGDTAAIRLDPLPAEPTENEVVETALARARDDRDAKGWETVYNRQRALR